MLAAPQPTLRQQAGTFSAWFAEHAGEFITIPLRILLIVTIAIVAHVVARRLITRAVKRMKSVQAGGYARKGPAVSKAEEINRRIARERRDQRAKTIGAVLSSTVTIVIVTIAALVVLGELGINLAPIIASAGIIGLAIGFGAQSLVQDFIAGMFILIEDQYGVGDWVDVGAASGEVEEINLRVTKLRDGDGALWYVRNGEIMRVGNHSQGWARAILDVPVGYHEDLDRARELLTRTASELWHDDAYDDVVLSEPELWGVQALDRDAVVVRLAVITAPLEQWGVARELRRRIKEAFDEHGIQIPFPQQTIWMRTADPSVAATETGGHGSQTNGHGVQPAGSTHGSS